MTTKEKIFIQSKFESMFSTRYADRIKRGWHYTTPCVPRFIEKDDIILRADRKDVIVEGVHFVYLVAAPIPELNTYVVTYQML